MNQIKWVIIVLTLSFACSSVSGDVLAVWGNFLHHLPINVTLLDPSTGKASSGSLFSETNNATLFGGQSTFDPDSQTLFIAIVSPSSIHLYSTIYGINLITSSIIYIVPLQFTCNILHFDIKTGNLVVGGIRVSNTGAPSNILIGTVDTDKQTYTQIATLPAGHRFTVLTGSASDLDPTSRQLATITVIPSTHNVYYVSVINVDSGETKTVAIQNTNWALQTLNYVSLTGKWITLMNNLNSNGKEIFNLTSGTLDIKTGNVQQLGEYFPSVDYAVVVTAISVVGNKQLYSIIGTKGLTSSIVVSDVVTGDFVSGVAFGEREGEYEQPLFLAYMN